jgi:hypothetical protein
MGDVHDNKLSLKESNDQDPATPVGLLSAAKMYDKDIHIDLYRRGRGSPVGSPDGLPPVVVTKLQKPLSVDS